MTASACIQLDNVTKQYPLAGGSETLTVIKGPDAGH